ncbi:MAG: helix-turn-helix transcriptional regulator [Clostridia bacterium]|nr:helix-turn-helix transcriptional regulator [Clostridia bacterium]
MIAESIKTVCAGGCSIRRTVVHRAVPNPKKYICIAGQRQYDRFFYVTAGCFHLKNKNGSELVAEAGSVLYLPTDVEYESYWDEEQQGGFLSFNFCLMDEEGRPLSLAKEAEAVAKDPKGELYALFNGALECYVHAERFAELRLQGYFYDILYGIVKQVERRRLKQEEDVGRIYKALIHLNDHYMSEVTAEELAAMCGMSVATFRRLFKKYKQTSPLKYKNHLRMLHAREMLQSGLYTVSEICELVNCTDLSHFNKMYRAEFGINPSADVPD